MAPIINDEEALREAVVNALNDPELKLTLLELENETEIAKSYIHSIKQQAKPGSLSALFKLADILGIKYRFTNY